MSLRFKGGSIFFLSEIRPRLTVMQVPEKSGTCTPEWGKTGSTVLGDISAGLFPRLLIRFFGFNQNGPRTFFFGVNQNG